MTIALWLRGLLALGLVLIFSPSVQAHPAMFSELPLLDAIARAKADHKYLLIDFTASWCPPCKRMDETTWSDPLVKKWVDEKAIAIQIDVDRQREAATNMKIMAMPTVIVFAANNYDTEFDRQVGYQTTNELLGWLKGIEAGKTTASAMESEAAKVFGKGGDEEVQARYALARRFQDAGKYPQATEQYIWLWKNIPTQDAPMGGVRGSYMISDMGRLVTQYPEAKPKLAELRDAAEKSGERLDWVCMNEALGDDARTLAWFDSVKTQPDSGKLFDHVDFKLENLLIANNRWSDIGAYLYKDPLKQLKKSYEFLARLRDFDQSKEGQSVGGKVEDDFNPFTEEAGCLYAACLAAGHEGDADKVVAESMRMDDSEKLRQSLVSKAYRAGQSGESQLKLLQDVPPGAVTDRQFYWTRANTYRDIKQFSLALADYSEAIRQGPASSVLYFNRASVYEKLGKTDLAAKDRKKSKELGDAVQDGGEKEPAGKGR